MPSSSQSPAVKPNRLPSKRFAWMLLALLLGGTTVLAAEMREVNGRVVDERGEPVAGIDVAGYWTRQGGPLTPRAGVKTDAEGRFKIRVSWQGRARTLMTLDAKRERGAIALLDEAALAKEHTLRLAPLVTLKGAVESTGLGETPDPVYVAVTAKGAIIATAASTKGSTFSLPLPAGSYRLTISPRHCKRFTKTVELEADAGVLDLGTMDATPTVIAEHYGKSLPPWSLTEARGVEKTMKLSDYKGKWVLIEFWGFW